MTHSEETGHREMALLTKMRSRPDAGDATIPTFPNGIKVWYDPGHADVDIVFIHGLPGDRERTWTHEAALEPWPKAILPDHLPSARILTFGYDAYIVRKGKAVTNQLMDHSKDFLNALTSQRHSKRASSRALIFVAHSLGGLVCKDAILHSRNNPEPHLRAIYESTVAIAFLGTPHGGSDLASWARLPVKALGVLKSTNTDLLSVLQTSSEVLRRVQDDFLSMIRDLASQGRSLKITCFWESQPMPFAGTIVERSSATLPGYNAISIHANHRDMVRFHAPEDPGFLSVLGELRRWLADVQASELDLTADARAKELEEKRLEQTRIECLKSLTFAEMGARKSNIDEPNPHTCEWIFLDRHYQSWGTFGGHRESQNLLWIKGKPGSGKSTLMKQITQEREQRSLTNGTFCLSFFFNARGAQLERSTLGLYRALLFQLLQKSKATMAQFLPRFLEKEEQHPGEKVTWQMTEISDFFHAAISESTLRPLWIFIDALDECEEYEVRKVVHDFEKSSAAAVLNGAKMKICLSSRHYPHISLRIISGQEIHVERHNASDIRRYVSQELILDESDLRVELSEGIATKAGGIFFWVLFMVRRLLKASDQGFTESQMRNLLQNVPPTLEGLFEETLRGMEPERRFSFATLAPWVICSFRPLKLYELYVAVTFTSETPPASLMDLEIGATFDQQRFQKFVTDASGGLFESVSVSDETVVQVIHESFREFFLGSVKAAEFLQLPPGVRFPHHAHERIVTASKNYFNVKELRQPLPAPEINGIIALEKLTSMLCRPLAVSVSLLANYGIPYFHDYVFLHLEQLTDHSGMDLENSETPPHVTRTRILEGWLVLLYFFVIETGALSLPQCNALDVLVRKPFMVGLSTPEVACIIRHANNLVIFVNKAMKDGFVLKDASTSPCGRMLVERRASLYLRIFERSELIHQVVDGMGSCTHKFVHHPDYTLTPKYRADNSWTSNKGLLAFCMTADWSPQLGELEECWHRRQYPLITIPLRDWRIIERSGHNIVDTATATFQVGDILRCSSVLLHLQQPAGVYLECGGRGGAAGAACFESWAIIIRVDWELKHYSLWRNRFLDMDAVGNTQAAASDHGILPPLQFSWLADMPPPVLGMDFLASGLIDAHPFEHLWNRLGPNV
ncbi:hypothetical protein PV11_03289 [Exophiala sideris]|uniref:NACHT domain-containing protein n=1 Tax=Exophiala sideris TaxID=1016849 RepID=A0A0D1YYS1_9EURO|nr:hypothetical protein PV11_03289 [Exophiala sideris]